MAKMITNDNLKNLKEYIAEEAKRLGGGNGRVHHIDLDEVDDEGKMLIQSPVLDPIQRDLDLLYGSSNGRKKS